MIRNAKGLAIFTTMRTGLWIASAGGSGVLVARMPDGTWSPPSGIMTNTMGFGFLVGVDIYDCVLVLNTQEAVDGFTKIRCTLGGEVSVVAGPVGVGGVLETEVHKRQAPIFTYVKSRGLYAGVQVEGTIVIERMDENERFYGEELPVKDILAGKVRHPPYEINRLMETIKAAQGDTVYDESLIPNEPPPGDYEIDDGIMFGVPDKQDPDPYGVLALEKEGMSLREAGTQQRASWEQFSFNPAPTSPIHSIYARNSHDGGSRTIKNRSSWRNTLSSEYKAANSLRNSMEVRSITSAKSVRSPVADSSTQTDFADDLPSPRGRRSSNRSSQQSSKGGAMPYTIHEDDRPSSQSVQTTVATGTSGEAKDETSRKTSLAFSDEPTGLSRSLVESGEERVSAMDSTPARSEPVSVSTHNGISTPPATPGEVDIPKALRETTHHLSDEDADRDSDSDDYDDEDVQIIEQPVVQSVQAMQVQTPHGFPGAAKVITVPKRLPPKLPPRNPNRGRKDTPVVDNLSPSAEAEKFDPSASPALVVQDAASFKPSAAVSEVSSENADLDDRDGPHFTSSSPLDSADVQEGQELEITMHETKPNETVTPAHDPKMEHENPELVPKVPGGFE